MKHENSQSVEARTFLTKWTIIVGVWSAVASILIPPLGVMLGVLSLSFGYKIKPMGHWLPYAVLIFSLLMCFTHVYIWSQIIVRL